MDLPFLAPQGPSSIAKDQKLPLDYFYLLLGDTFFHFLQEETIRYARQKGNQEFNVTPNEMSAFVGINIAMGIVNMPKLHDFWSTNPILGLVK